MPQSIIDYQDSITMETMDHRLGYVLPRTNRIYPRYLTHGLTKTFGFYCFQFLTGQASRSSSLQITPVPLSFHNYAFQQRLLRDQKYFQKGVMEIVMMYYRLVADIGYL